MRNKKLMLITILLLGVGFALVSTTLLMTGNVKIATNDADFDVKFTKAVLDGTDISEIAISADGKTITFETSDLTTVGDISKLDFEVTNNSEMYDAEVSIDCTSNGTNKDHYEITKEVASPISGKTTKSGKVEVKLLKASLEDFSEEFTCTLSATAKERTSKAEPPQIYYAFGDPLTAVDKTTEYATLKYPGTDTSAKVFVKLSETQKSVCIIRDSWVVDCFKNNNWAEEKTHITQVFSDIGCDTSDGINVYCYASDFYCHVNSDGNVYCIDEATTFSCFLYSNGNVICRK